MTSKDISILKPLVIYIEMKPRAEGGCAEGGGGGGGRGCVLRGGPGGLRGGWGLVPVCSLCLAAL